MSNANEIVIIVPQKKMMIDDADENEMSGIYKRVPIKAVRTDTTDGSLFSDNRENISKLHTLMK
jgi:hypothetical protein